jgi:hypothetical protein
MAVHKLSLVRLTPHSILPWYTGKSSSDQPQPLNQKTLLWWFTGMLLLLLLRDTPQPRTHNPIGILHRGYWDPAKGA